MKTAQYDNLAQLAYYEAVGVADERYIIGLAVAHSYEARLAARLNHTRALKSARAVYEGAKPIPTA
jgi:hypothetical protein